MTERRRRQRQPPPASPRTQPPPGAAAQGGVSRAEGRRRGGDAALLLPGTGAAAAGAGQPARRQRQVAREAAVGTSAVPVAGGAGLPGEAAKQKVWGGGRRAGPRHRRLRWGRSLGGRGPAGSHNSPPATFSGVPVVGDRGARETAELSGKCRSRCCRTAPGVRRGWKPRLGGSR